MQCKSCGLNHTHLKKTWFLGYVDQPIQTLQLFSHIEEQPGRLHGISSRALAHRLSCFQGFPQSSGGLGRGGREARGLGCGIKTFCHWKSENRISPAPPWFPVLIHSVFVFISSFLISVFISYYRFLFLSLGLLSLTVSVSACSMLALYL